jgi:DNA-binding NarL/FixJ family response regulator
MSDRIEVILADDHTLLRKGLRALLNNEPDIEVIAEAADGAEAVRACQRLTPDVVVMDISMPNLNGADATHIIRHQFPSTKVVILTMHENRQYLQQIVRAGAIGCVLKRSAGRDLVAAVRAAARNESFFSPAVANMMVEDWRAWHHRHRGNGNGELTEREQEVLKGITQGETSQEIAGHLGISIKTVQTHRSHLMHKLDAHDRTELIERGAQR